MAALSSTLNLHRPALDTTVVLGPVLHFPSLFSPDEQLALFRDLSSVAASYCAGKKGKEGGGGASYGRGGAPSSVVDKNGSLFETLFGVTEAKLTPTMLAVPEAIFNEDVRGGLLRSAAGEVALRVADDTAFAFDLPEPENPTQLRLQIDLINSLRDAPDDAPEDASESMYVYRYSFPLEKGTPVDAFWSAMQLKAAEANLFVDVIAECAVKHTADFGFVRDILVKPAPGVEIRATERVFVAEDRKTILYRERTGKFCCLNELSVDCGTAVLKGTYVYPAPRSRADFLADNEAMFNKLQTHANGDQSAQEIRSPAQRAAAVGQQQQQGGRSVEPEGKAGGEEGHVGDGTGREAGSRVGLEGGGGARDGDGDDGDGNGTTQVGTAQVGTAQVGTAQVGTTQVGIAWRGTQDPLAWVRKWSLPYDTSFVDCFRYPAGSGSLRGHVDCLWGQVMVVSLGCDATFWWEEPAAGVVNDIFALRDAARKPRASVTLRSGDAVVFDGGVAANLLHGVSGVAPGTAPEWFPDSEARFCIQYRQARPG